MVRIEQFNIFQLEKYCVEIFLNSSNTPRRVSQFKSLVRAEMKAQEQQ